ncbi:MAG: bifunctional phosphoglucose/phosphomannose isomerase [Thermoprotei archaeon]
MDLENQYRGWIKQIKDALDEWSSISISGDYEYVVIAGMGGSGIVGDYLDRLSRVYGGLPVVVVKDNYVPAYIGEKSLVIAVSYSGNTHETISFVREAGKRVRNMVIVTSDGVLADIAREKNYVLVTIPSGFVPRASLPYMLYRILGVLDSSGYSIVSRGVAEESLRFLESEHNGIRSNARRVAEYIDKYKRLLILAGHSPYEPLLVRGKNEFNENSKIPVKIECAPEWMHNDIVGWEKPYSTDYAVLSVVDPDDSIGLKLVEYMESVYRELGIPVYRIELKGSSFLDKLMYGSLLLGYSSIELAYKRRINPLVTTSIAKYKEIASRIYG